MHGQQLVTMSTSQQREYAEGARCSKTTVLAPVCGRLNAKCHCGHVLSSIILHETMTNMRCCYLLFDAPPVKLRPLLKKPLVLVGFFSLEAFTAGAGM